MLPVTARWSGFGLEVVVLVLAGVWAWASGTSSPPIVDRDANRHVVRVYYFHTSQRCATCKRIEALSEEAVRTGFRGELERGEVEWRVVNLDDPASRHFTQDYELYTKSVVVTERVGDRETRWKQLPRVWELVRDPPGFRQYVQREVQGYLEGGP